MIQHIIIADDHSLILDGFERVIRARFPEAAVRKAKDKHTLLEMMQNQPPEVLFQDIKFGKHDARDFVKELKEAYPDTKIVIISTLVDDVTIHALLNQGADGYISKTDDSEELIRALEHLQNGQRYLSPDIRNMGIHRPPSSRIFLTEREQTVLSHIINGKTTKEIAAMMFLSDKTIEIHRSNLFLKFEVNNVALLVKKAIYEGYS